MSLCIKRGDLFNQKVDAYVIPSQPSLKLEGQIGARLNDLCGKKLQIFLKQLKGPDISECVFTPALDMLCKWLIFVSTPRYARDDKEVENLLISSYENALELAKKLGISSIAFPLLSAVAYEYPKK